MSGKDNLDPVRDTATAKANVDGIIYEITNVVTGKKYIGQTIRTLKERWTDHRYSVKSGKTKLCRSMRKHGIENFTIREICKVETIDQLNYMEEYVIKELDTVKSGYNMCFGGMNTSRISKNGLTTQQNRFVRLFKKADMVLQCMILGKWIITACIEYLKLHRNEKESNKPQKHNISDEEINIYIESLKKGTFKSIRHRLFNLLEIILTCNEECRNG